MSNKNTDTQIFTVGSENDAFDIAGAEKSLLLAILQTAASDLNKDGHLAQRAAEFFLAAEEDYVFSFRSICHYLKVDHKQVLRVVGLLPLSTDGNRSVWSEEEGLEEAFERLKIRL